MKNYKMTSISLVVILTAALASTSMLLARYTNTQTHKKHYKNI